MFYSLRILKELNFGKKKYFFLFKRSLNVSKYYLKKKRIYISRGLYPVKYYGGQYLYRCVNKFGDFAFTRKPFAIPENKYRRRR